MSSIATIWPVYLVLGIVVVVILAHVLCRGAAKPGALHASSTCPKKCCKHIIVRGHKKSDVEKGIKALTEFRRDANHKKRRPNTKTQKFGPKGAPDVHNVRVCGTTTSKGNHAKFYKQIDSGMAALGRLMVATPGAASCPAVASCPAPAYDTCKPIVFAEEERMKKDLAEKKQQQQQKDRCAACVTLATKPPKEWGAPLLDTRGESNRDQHTPRGGNKQRRRRGEEEGNRAHPGAHRPVGLPARPVCRLPRPERLLLLGRHQAPSSAGHPLRPSLFVFKSIHIDVITGPRPMRARTTATCPTSAAVAAAAGRPSPG